MAELGKYVINSQTGGKVEFIPVHSTPSGTTQKVNQISSKATLTFTVYESKNGYYRITPDGSSAAQWVYGGYFKKQESVSYTPPTKSTIMANTTANAEEIVIEDEGYDFALDELNVGTNDSILNWPNDDDYKNMSNYTNMFGAPFLFLDETDPCYFNDEMDGAKIPKVGRVMMNTMYSAPDCFSICPGKVRYLPGFNKTKKDEFFNEVMGKMKNLDSTFSQTAEPAGRFSGQLYEFTCDYNDYMNRFNVLARTSAIMLGLGDRCMPGTTIKLKNYDYSYYTTSERKTDADTGIKDSFLWQLEVGAESTIIEKQQYIHFFITNEGSSVTQNFTTTTSQSPLKSIIHESQISDAAKNLSYLFGGAMSGDGFMGAMGSDIEKLIADASASGSYTGSFASMALGYLKGGRMIMPDMIDEVGYENAVQCRMKFQALYGNKLDIFLRTILPTLGILNFVMPKQLADNMYSYPYIIRGYHQGQYNTDLAVIQNLVIDRGGQENTSWTVDGLSTEIEVTFDIVPLYSSLMGGNGKNPFQFMMNTSLLEYLGNLCGLDLKVNNIALKQDLFNALLANRFTDIPQALGGKISSKFADKFKDWFSF